MDLTVVTKLGEDTRTEEVDSLMQKHLANKLGKLEQRQGKPLTARIVVEELPVGFEATITLHATPDMVGKARGDRLLKAVDLAVAKLTRQFEDHTDRRSDKQRRTSGTLKQAGSL